MDGPLNTASLSLLLSTKCGLMAPKSPYSRSLPKKDRKPRVFEFRQQTRHPAAPLRLELGVQR